MKKWIGDRAFYRMVLSLALPLLLQNAVTTFVNLLDNLMVGQIGTEQMSGVSIVNQLIFIYNLCLFGGTGGAGIFAAQFRGREDWEGVRGCLRFNLIVVSAFALLAVSILGFGRNALIGAFLHNAEGGGDLEATLRFGREYLQILLWGLPPFGLTCAYAGVLRVTGDTKLPMRASIAALTVNLVFNWLLIFGKCGFPVLGVRGAAIATVLSRYVEVGIILIVTHRGQEKYPFAVGLLRHFRIPAALTKRILIKGMPLMANELFWSLGQTVQFQCYSYRGLTAVAALNINSVVQNLFNTVFFTLGNCVGIILGNLLGAGEFDRARAASPKLMFLGFASCCVTGGLLAAAAPWIPHFYNTTDAVMATATQLMWVGACMMPIHSLVHSTYFTLRCGGRTYITVLFDSVFSWVFYVPASWLLVHFTALPLVTVFALVNLLEFVKVTLGLTLVHKGVWVRNIITE